MVGKTVCCVHVVQVIGFNQEEVATFVAVVGILSVIAQVSNQFL